MLAATLLWLAPAGSGCSGRQTVHSALRVTEEDIERGTSRGKSIIGYKELAFEGRSFDVNLRVSGDVVFRSAGLGLPADLIAYEIAKGGDASDAGIRRALAAALKRIERETMCVAVVQVPMSRDPAEIKFALRSSMGVEYPPTIVENPVLVRRVEFSIINPNAAAAGLYSYVLHFPVRGGPGVPPIGPQVNSVNLIVRDGDSEASATFPLKSRET